MGEFGYPCVCCGYTVHDEPPGSYHICPVCFWEDDQVQLRWPTLRGGANQVSLIEAQKNYSDYGVSELRFRFRVRGPREGELRARGFRPVDPALDDFEPVGVSGGEWPEDRTRLYWWTEGYWRRAD